MRKRMFDVVEPKKERTSKKLNLGNCKENSGDEIFRILSEIQNKEEKLLIVCLRKSFLCRKKKLNSGE